MDSGGGGDRLGDFWFWGQDVVQGKGERMRTNIQNIPVDGNFGGVASGPVLFRKDWPGLFLNGADCQELYGVLRYLRQGFEGNHTIDKMPAMLVDIERTLAEGVLGNPPDGKA